MLQLFLGTCQAVRAMHTYVPGPSATYPPSSNLVSNGGASKGKGKARRISTDGDDDASRIEQQEEEEEEAIRAAAGAAEPLIGSIDRAAEVDETDANDVPGLGEDAVTNSTGHQKLIGRLPVPSTSPNPASRSSTPGAGVPQPYAHRDIKPANVMVSDDGTQPILMDFGSALPARIEIRNRSDALKQADDAGEHCTMPFRAPELFDPPVGSTLDEKVVSEGRRLSSRTIVRARRGSRV